MKLDFSVEIHACFEYISLKRQGFLFSVAENKIRKICNEARRRLRDNEFEIIKNDDSIGTAAYKIKSTSTTLKSLNKKKTQNENEPVVNEKETLI